jgi:preprotein translocase subunit SecY
MFWFQVLLSWWFSICNVVRRKITDKGIGNGISILIMVGILQDSYSFLQEVPCRTVKEEWDHHDSY